MSRKRDKKKIKPEINTNRNKNLRMNSERNLVKRKAEDV